jgi:VWFA-related protein
MGSTVYNPASQPPSTAEVRVVSRLGIACAVIALLVSARVAPHAAGTQEAPQQPGTFRARITLVPVDVRVLDRDGKPVTDLTQDDFTILEDNVRQDIRHFSRHGLMPEAPEPGATPRLRSVPALELQPQNHRTFLIVLGRGRLQEPSKALTAAVRFVRERLLPQDLVAVLAYNRATDFTTDHEGAIDVLERFKGEHERIEALLAQRFSPLMDGTPALAAIYGSKDIPVGTQTLIDRVFRGPGALASRQLPAATVTARGQIEEDTRRTIRALTDAELRKQREELDNAAGLPTPTPRSEFNGGESDLCSDLPFGTYVADNVQTLQDLQNLYAGIQYMRYLEGEKHVVFLSEQGLFLPRLEDDWSLAAAANDARVAIDTIQTGGLWSGPLPASHRTPPPIPGPSISHTFAMGTLKTVSELTGGQASIYAYADPALTRISQTTLSEYLLGYYPSNSTWDGRYRRITVKVNRPGVRVLFRHGYFGREVRVPFDREAFLSYSRIAAASGYDGDVRDIRLTLKASEVKSGGGAKPGVFVEVKIDLGRVGFEQADDRRVGALDVAIFCTDGKETLVGDLWQKIDLNLRDDTYKRLLEEGLTYSALIAVKARPALVKAVVYDRRADLVGSTAATVR